MQLLNMLSLVGVSFINIRLYLTLYVCVVFFSVSKCPPYLYCIYADSVNCEVFGFMIYFVRDGLFAHLPLQCPHAPPSIHIVMMLMLLWCRQIEWGNLKGLIELTCNILMSVLLFTVCKKKSSVDYMFVEVPLLVRSWLNYRISLFFYCLFTLDQMRHNLMLLEVELVVREWVMAMLKMKWIVINPGHNCWHLAVNYICLFECFFFSFKCCSCSYDSGCTNDQGCIDWITPSELNSVLPVHTF